MTTPARNVEETAMRTAVNKYGPPWYPDANIISIDSVETFRVDKRPASVTSPLRADGTRAPRSYSREWGNVVVPWGPHLSTDIWGWLLQSNSGPIGQVFPRMVPRWAANQSAFAFPQRVIDQATTKVRNKMRDSEFNLGVALGESRETVGLISQSVNRVVSGIDGFLKTTGLTRRQFQRFLRSPRKVGFQALERALGVTSAKNAANLWLEYQYGWKPMINDCYGAATKLDDMVNGQGMPLSCIARAGASEVDEELLFPWADPIGRGIYKAGANFQTTSRVHYALTYAIPDGTLPQLTQLGLTNPAELAWELLPYSFCVDWFVDVGSWISSLNATAGLFFLEGTRTRVQEVVSVDWRVKPTNIGGSVDLFPHRGVYLMGAMHREVLGSFPGPAILPTIKTRLGLPQMASALSLLIQRIT